MLARQCIFQKSFATSLNNSSFVHVKMYHQVVKMKSPSKSNAVDNSDKMVTFEEECSQVDDCEVQCNKAGYFCSI